MVPLWLPAYFQAQAQGWPSRLPHRTAGWTTVLWDALSGAGPDGVSVGDLAPACGRTSRWVYYRLREHAAADRAVQVRRGYWRAAAS